LIHPAAELAALAIQGAHAHAQGQVKAALSDPNASEERVWERADHWARHAAAYATCLAALRGLA
jgi:hypothetical protein